MTINFSCLFYALDDELDLEGLVGISSKHNYYGIENNDDSENDMETFVAESPKFLKRILKLVKSYKKDLKNHKETSCEPFNTAFKEYCMRNIETVIESKMTVLSKKFSSETTDKNLIVISIMPFNITFVLFCLKETVQFAIGVHCGQITMVNKDFIYKNCETSIKDFFMENACKKKKIFKAVEFWTNRWLNNNTSDIE